MPRSIEEELSVAIESIGSRFTEFKSDYERRFQEEREFRDELERKMNLLRVVGGSIEDLIGIPAKRSPQEEFELSCKSWYPHRPQQQVDYADYRKAFGVYIRYGLDSVGMEERKALQVGVDPDGGYLAPTEYARIMIKVERENSVMRGIARSLPMGGADIEFPMSLTRPAVGWVGETQSRSSTATPSLGMFKLESKEIYAQPEATQKIIDDSAFDIEAFLGEEVGSAFAESEDAEFIAGDGIVTPRGFTTYPTEATSDAAGTRPNGTIEHIATGQSGAWPTTDAAIYDKLVDVVFSLRPAYRRRAQWVMPTSAIARLRKMKTATTSEPIWQPSVMEGQPNRLLGYPVVEAEQMPAIAANSLSVAFADWQRAYWIVDRMGVRVLRDPYTNKPYVRFYTTKRLSGGVADTRAIKLLKFSAS